MASNESTPSRVFTLIGDSNVRNNMNPTNCRDRPLMSSAQVLICTKLPVLHQSLQAINSESNVCILSCITNFLCDSSSTCVSLSQRVEPVLTEFFRLVTESCSANSERRYLVCPPMYRKTPVWLRDGLPEILTMFSTSYAKAAVTAKNLHALPGFPTPAFDSDGVHLTSYSGMEFVLHLFDSSKILLDCLGSSLDAREAVGSEVLRSLGDRMIVIEQDHRRLVDAFDLKTAIDAELACFRTNERNEDSFLISGIQRLRDGLSGRAWQEEAKKEVLRVLALFVDRNIKIVVVHNVTGRSPSAEVSFSVRLSSVEDARLIRSKFSSFFSGGRDTRPRDLKSISIRNVLTKETRIRISIMKILGARYKDSNQGSSYQLIGFEARPLLKIIPPEGASDRRVKTFTYIEAIKKLKVSFTDEELSGLAKQIGSQFSGRLKSVFGVIDDDKMRDIRSKAKARADRSDRNKRARTPDDDEVTRSRPRL